ARRRAQDRPIAWLYLQIRGLLLECAPLFWPTTFRAALLHSLSMPLIRVKENEPFDVALRRFKRAVEKTGLLTELRAREFYEKPTADRKRKHAAAAKRRYKRRRAQMLPPQPHSEARRTNCAATRAPRPAPLAHS